MGGKIEGGEGRVYGGRVIFRRFFLGNTHIKRDKGLEGEIQGEGSPVKKATDRVPPLMNSTYKVDPSLQSPQEKCIPNCLR